MIARIRASLGGIHEYFRAVITNFGIDFATALLSIYFGLKGLTSQLIQNACLPYFKKLGVSGETYQSYTTVANTPWAMKAAIGLLSDAVPLFGYHKRSYIVILSIVGSIALGLLAFTSLNESTVFIGAILLLFFQLQVASVDLLTEGKYAEKMVSKPETGSQLVSFAWGMQSVGSLFGCIISAVMIARSEPKYIFLVGLPLALQVIIPAVTGWFPEERLPPGNRGIRYDKIRQFPDMFKLSVALTIGAVLVGGSGFYDSFIQSNVSVVVSITLAILGFIWLPETLRRTNLYLFLNNMLYISIQGAMDYWMTAGETCVPGGPNFSMSFYVSYANLIGSLASVFGVVLFEVYFSRGTFRKAFLAAGIVKIAASTFDFVLIKRLNKRIGIPDAVFFTMGDAVIFQVINRLEIMPSIVLTSKVCPPGMESSVYALLVSYQNLGIAVSRTLGDFLIDIVGIKTIGECNFDYLPHAVLIAHVVVPSLIFPLIFILIPDALMTDDLVNVEDINATNDYIETAFDDNDDNDEDNNDFGDNDEKAKLTVREKLRNGESIEDDDVPADADPVNVPIVRTSLTINDAKDRQYSDDRGDKNENC